MRSYSGKRVSCCVVITVLVAVVAWGDNIESAYLFDMVYYPNKPHSFRNAFSVLKVWDFLVRHLYGQDPPAYHITAWED